MKVDIKKINSTLDQLANDWSTSGQLVLMKDGQVIHQNAYGFADRAKGLKSHKDTPYLINTATGFFAKLAVLLLVDEGKIRLSHKVDQYIPEYQHGHRISIKQLLSFKSGMKDFYHGMIMVDLENSDDYHQLSKADRLRLEHQKFFENYQFATAFNMVKDKKLEFEPGLTEEYSDTEFVFMTEIVERLTGMKLVDYLNEKLFKPLKMDKVKVTSMSDTVSYCEYDRKELVRIPFAMDVENIMSVTMDDIIKFAKAMANKEVLSEKLWKQVTKFDKEGQSILTSNANGFNCVSSTFLGFDILMYFNFETGLSFHTMTNEEPLFEYKDNNWQYFRKDLRGAVTSLMTYPENTRMVKVNKSNVWDAMGLSIKEEQHDFVLDPKSSVGMCAAYPSKTAYAQMEGDLVVGLLVLGIDKKKEEYNIDIIIIDEKYQGKGYGKLMVKWAVETLKDAGAKELTIGVNRKNEAAKKVYLNAGFVPDSVYPDGMGLKLTL